MLHTAEIACDDHIDVFVQQPRRTSLSLRDAFRCQLTVEMPLNALLAVPEGFAVTDNDERRGRHPNASANGETDFI